MQKCPDISAVDISIDISISVWSKGIGKFWSGGIGTF